MRGIAFLACFLLATACSQSPQDKQVDAIRSQAKNEAAAIKARGDAQAIPLDQQSEALSLKAKQAGGYEGKRLNVQARASKEQAKLIRQQAEQQSGAVKEAADARIKALESR